MTTKTNKTGLRFIDKKFASLKTTARYTGIVLSILAKKGTAGREDFRAAGVAHHGAHALLQMIGAGLIERERNGMSYVYKMTAKGKAALKSRDVAEVVKVLPRIVSPEFAFDAANAANVRLNQSANIKALIKSVSAK